MITTCSISAELALGGTGVEVSDRVGVAAGRGVSVGAKVGVDEGVEVGGYSEITLVAVWVGSEILPAVGRTREAAGVRVLIGVGLAVTGATA